MPPNLPDRKWKKADGWVIRNLRYYGNSTVPRRTVGAFRYLYDDEWEQRMCEVLTRILREQNVLRKDQSVWLEHSTEFEDLYIARWY